MVLLLALVATMPGAAHSATALIVGGAGKYAVLTEEQMAAALGGRFKDYTRVNVPFPGLPDDLRYSLDVGTENLHAAVYATPGPKTIGGVSEGAPVVDEVLRRLMNDPNPPPAGELNAVMLGTMSPIWYLFTGVDYRAVADTRYDVMVVKAEYDGIADWPDNWINVLAVANAVLGALQLHVSSAFYDISLVPPEYVARKTNSEGGTTTTVLIPTPLLPLLKPLADAGASQETIDCLDGVIRPIIDSGYWRFWFKDRSSGWPLPPPEPAGTAPMDIAVPEPGSPGDVERDLGAGLPPVVDPESDQSGTAAADDATAQPTDDATVQPTDDATVQPTDVPAPSDEAVGNREQEDDRNAATGNGEVAPAGDDAAAAEPEENESVAPAPDEAMADDGADSAGPSSSTSDDAPDAIGK
ncbi:PE-PPE domain-containing protein [Mycolicibacterium vanbaalenii]|nr:PE-PPE domain-containing protein [Mycolicibacterium vanbaalenii]